MKRAGVEVLADFAKNRPISAVWHAKEDMTPPHLPAMVAKRELPLSANECVYSSYFTEGKS